MLLLEDLRFFIGLFFSIIGILLIGESFYHPTSVEGFNLNLITGCVFASFGLIALLISLRAFRSNRAISLLN